MGYGDFVYCTELGYGVKQIADGTIFTLEVSIECGLNLVGMYL